MFGVCIQDDGLIDGLYLSFLTYLYFLMFFFYSDHELHIYQLFPEQCCRTEQPRNQWLTSQGSILMLMVCNLTDVGWPWQGCSAQVSPAPCCRLRFRSIPCVFILGLWLRGQQLARTCFSFQVTRARSVQVYRKTLSTSFQYCIIS